MDFLKCFPYSLCFTLAFTKYLFGPIVCQINSKCNKGQPITHHFVGGQTPTRFGIEICCIYKDLTFNVEK